MLLVSLGKMMKNQSFGGMVLHSQSTDCCGYHIPCPCCCCGIGTRQESPGRMTGLQGAQVTQGGKRASQKTIGQSHQLLPLPISQKKKKKVQTTSYDRIEETSSLQGEDMMTVLPYSILERIFLMRLGSVLILPHFKGTQILSIEEMLSLDCSGLSQVTGSK